MANKRIKDLATTATTTAADDFIALDGETNDTRKMSADNLALKNTANTFSQNQTLNGTNNVAPNQTAASGSSLMTRDLVDAQRRDWNTIFQTRHYNVWLSGIGTTYATAPGFLGTSLHLTSLSSSNNSGLVLNTPSAVGLSNLFNTSGTSLDFNKKYKLSWRVNAVAAGTSSTVIRLMFGATNISTPAIGAPAAKSFGFLLKSNGTSYAIWVFGHDGTTLSETDTTLTLSTSSAAWSVLEVENNGSGTITAFVNGVASGTVSGPTGAGTSSVRTGISQELDMATTSASARLYISDVAIYTEP